MAADILEYPYPLNLRWNHIAWYPVFHRRYLHSEFVLLADLEVQGAAFMLMLHAMNSLPPATLSGNASSHARYLRIEPEAWASLMAREFNPLHGWIPIQCGDERRITHPLLLEGLEISVKAAKLRQRGTTNRRQGQPPDAGRAPK